MEGWGEKGWVRLVKDGLDQASKGCVMLNPYFIWMRGLNEKDQPGLVYCWIEG